MGATEGLGFRVQSLGFRVGGAGSTAHRVEWVTACPYGAFRVD